MRIAMVALSILVIPIMLGQCFNPKPQAKPAQRKYNPSELCMGRCFPLIVSRFDSDNHICECRSRDAR